MSDGTDGIPTAVVAGTLIAEVCELVADRVSAAGPDATARLFTCPRGGRIHHRSATRRDSREPGGAALSYEHRHHHDLRHTVHVQFRHFVGLQTIQDLLGYNSIGVTNAIYVDVLREVQRDAVDRLSHLFGPDDEVDTAP